MNIDVGVSQWQGRRKSQQDKAKVVLLEDGYHAILCDGMGGAAGGEVASSIVCEEFALVDHSQSFDEGQLHSIARANNALRRHIKADSSLTGMGTTLVSVVVSNMLLKWLSVGDSPLWLIRGGTIERLNLDESYGGHLDRKAAKGEITQEEAQSNPRRNHLMNVLMGEERVQVEDLNSRGFDLEDGDIILIASDGLHTLSDDRIAEIVLRSKLNSAEEMIRQLMINVSGERHPKQDNVSIVLMKINQ